MERVPTVQKKQKIFVVSIEYADGVNCYAASDWELAERLADLGRDLAPWPNKQYIQETILDSIENVSACKS
jgi:hypothetical protein